MAMLELMTDEECLAAECFFGFCWWLGARDDQSPDDPAHSLYLALMSGHAADDPAALLSASKHAELRSSPALATNVLRHDKTRLSQHVTSADEGKVWRPGMDVDTHLPAFVDRPADSLDAEARLAAARGLVYEAFHFGARTAAMSGGRNDTGLGLVVRTAHYYADLFQKRHFPVSADELLMIIDDAAASAPGALGVFVVIPMVDEDHPDNIGEVRQSAAEMVDYLANGSALRLTSQVLDNRDLVSQVAHHLDLRPVMATNGVFVIIPLIDAENPANIAGVLRNAAFLVESLGQVPARVIDEPNLVARLANHLTAEDV